MTARPRGKAGAPQTVDYLVVAPHPDDAELGMGGTIAKLLAAGRRVGVVDLTSGEPTPFGTRAKRKRETAAATKVLGLTVRLNLGMTNRELLPTLDNRRRLAEAYRTLRPRVVFLPYWLDAHPDHTSATQLAEQARFHAKLTKTRMRGEPHYPGRLIYYYCTHLRRSADVAFVVDVSGHVDRKRQAIECYRSQFYDGRGDQAGAVLDYVLDANRYWGHQINRDYGEPFAVRETLGLDSLDSIL
ncbi:MAG: bacillithiol biosynthesis deacetylase BshB1 [Planctomycetes bacterium]|nr:bacillithiol biosynthesis deacetylase BshB1 [Planctomycetota bacterium]